MEKPITLKNSIALMWIVLGLTAISVLMEKLSGNFTMGIFVIELIVISLFTIFPIKINNGSDNARYVYVILNTALLFFQLGAEIEESKYTDITNLIGWITLFITLYTFYGIFSKESNEYFNDIKEKKITDITK